MEMMWRVGQDRDPGVFVRQKLQSIKPSVDNNAPKQQPHMYQKLKKAAMEEERQGQIERDNRTLVKRMTSIMQRSTIDSHNTTPAPGGGQVRSLNRDRRKRELVKVSAENQSLLRRIQQRQPVYSHLHWEQERQRNEELVNRLARHPRRRPGEAGQPTYYYDANGDPQPLGEDRADAEPEHQPSASEPTAASSSSSSSASSPVGASSQGSSGSADTEGEEEGDESGGDEGGED